MEMKGRRAVPTEAGGRRYRRSHPTPPWPQRLLHTRLLLLLPA